MKFNKYLIKTSVFLIGAVIMTYEILASRVLGPYFGLTIQVWANLIGTVLLALSLGSWLGGKIADRHSSALYPAIFLITSGFFILLTPIIAPFFCTYFVNLNISVNISSLFAALVVFGPATVFAGAFFPYAVKLLKHHENKIASFMGSLGAISTLGSLFGTFITSLVLLNINWLGTKKILFLSSGLFIFLGTLLLLSVIKTKKRSQFIFFFALSLLYLIFVNHYWDLIIPPLSPNNVLISEAENSYEPIRIIERENPDLLFFSLPKEFEILREMTVPGQNGVTASIFRDHPDQLSSLYYTGYPFLSWLLNPEIKNIAVIGCGGGLFPRDVLRMFPENQELNIDVVDINPEIFNLAQTFFSYPKTDRRILNHIQDGRSFLKKTSKQYDLIYWDTFGPGLIIPEHFMTSEFFNEVKSRLNKNGVFAVNIMSALANHSEDQPRANLYISLIKTIQSVFRDMPVFTFQLSRMIANDKSKISPYKAGNITILIVNSTDKNMFNFNLEWQNKLSRFSEVIYHFDIDDHLKSQVIPVVLNESFQDFENLPILTDDHNPINLYIASGLRHKKVK